MEECANSQGQQCRLEILSCKMEALNVTRTEPIGIWIAVALCSLISPRWQRHHTEASQPRVCNLYIHELACCGGKRPKPAQERQGEAHYSARLSPHFGPAYVCECLGEERHYGGL